MGYHHSIDTSLRYLGESSLGLGMKMTDFIPQIQSVQSESYVSTTRKHINYLLSNHVLRHIVFDAAGDFNRITTPAWEKSDGKYLRLFFTARVHRYFQPSQKRTCTKSALQVQAKLVREAFSCLILVPFKQKCFHVTRYVSFLEYTSQIHQ